MARYIDADVLWKRTTTKFDDCEEFLDLIETQPTAELPIKEKCCVCPHCDNCDVNEDGIIERKKGEWIPCSERLPDIRMRAVLVNVLPTAPYEIILCPANEVEGYYNNKAINAWMPLPAPYTESEVEDGEIH